MNRCQPNSRCTRFLRIAFRNVPKICATLVGAALISVTLPLSVQSQEAPIVPLGAAEMRSAMAFGQIYNVRELADGKVLVNDGKNRRLVILDEKFANVTVILDSTVRDGVSYGARAQPLIPYLGDSTIMVDIASTSLQLIDPHGKFTRSISVPHARDLMLMGLMGTGGTGVDPSGNLLYRGPQAQIMVPPPPGLITTTVINIADRAPVLRANFETRTVDTVGKMKIFGAGQSVTTRSPQGAIRTTITMNPLTVFDDWAVLSDGTIAFVRGQDYHIDFVRPDGTQFSTAKIAFPWKALNDSTKTAYAEQYVAAANRQVAAQRAMVAQTSTTPQQMPTIEYKSAPITEFPDYYPVLRNGGTRADQDGNLWVSTTASTNAMQGESVYDVFNNRGELTQRVRVPSGRYISGFGKRGAIYLAVYVDGNYTLERARVARP